MKKRRCRRERELEKLTAKKKKGSKRRSKKNVERDITVGEIVDILEETTAEPEKRSCTDGTGS